ncbi:MFS transporter [Streptomyces sp. NPDC089799]|uniref:MFS transporter n=1 Tax=Streptomyces sp. NPDC089799 TaxID=3155066 RepID=UPI00341BDCFC
MTPSPVRVPGTRARRRLAAALYGYSFLDDFVLLYPVYTLLFSDTGLSVWQISSLFVLWSLTGVLLELPSGAWADAFSRRALLCLGPLLTAAGFALWVLLPSYGAFAAGFLLWGAKGALGSGALEALVYEELERLGAADRYARTMGRARAAGTTAVAAAIGLAGPVFAAGGYPAVGAASVLACLLAAAAAACLPEHRPGPGAVPEPPAGAVHKAGPEPDPDLGPDPDPGRRAWLTALRAGVAEVRGDRALRGAVWLVPAVTAVWGALDEYAPLLVRDTGVADATVPYLLLLLWAGVAAGGLLAAPAERLGPRALAAVLTASALALAVGALLGTPAGITLLALAFCGFQVASVLADARLQDRIGGPARATVTSLAAMATDLGTIAVYGAYAAAASALPHRWVFALSAAPYLVTALLLSARTGAGPAPARTPARARTRTP